MIKSVIEIIMTEEQISNNFENGIRKVIREFIYNHPDYNMLDTSTSALVTKLNSEFEVKFEYNGYSVDLILRYTGKDDLKASKFELARTAGYEDYFDRLYKSIINILENFDSITTEWYKQLKTFEYNLNSIMAVNSIDADFYGYSQYY